MVRTDPAFQTERADKTLDRRQLPGEMRISAEVPAAVGSPGHPGGRRHRGGTRDYARHLTVPAPTAGPSGDAPGTGAPPTDLLVVGPHKQHFGNALFSDDLVHQRVVDVDPP